MIEMDEKQLKAAFLDTRPVFCSKCNGKLHYVGGGRYKCMSCEEECLDAFGTIKEYLDEHGPSSAYIISEETGVRLELIELFLRKGRLEILENSPFYLSCEKCGCAIKYGRYCPDCARTLLGGIKSLFHEDIGERPKSDTKKAGKMHFLSN